MSGQSGKREKVYEKHYPNDPPLTKEHREYLKIHLTPLDDVKKSRYLHIMRTWTAEDYRKMNQALLEMMGEEATDEDREFIRKILEKKN